MQTAAMDALRIGIVAIAVILLFKYLFVGLFPIPGLKQAMAAV